MTHRHFARTHSLVALVVLAALCVGPSRANGSEAPAPTYLRYTGDARTPDGATLLYREQHLLQWTDGALADRLVIYSCPDGRPFARKLLHYGSTPLAPDLRFDDARSGTYHELQTSGGYRRLRTRERTDAKPVEVSLASDPALVADAGFDEFIRRSWAVLLSGASVPFDILLLSDGSVLHLQARHLRRERSGGEDVEIFRVALSGLLRLVAPDINVAYASNSRVLRRFEGISNLRDERGRQARVAIDFPEAARQPASAAAWHDALSVPLVPRCE